MNSPRSKSVIKMKDGMLMCPACGELLFRADIEDYLRCPFCNQKFSPGTELEEFLLKPVIDHWFEVNMAQIHRVGQQNEHSAGKWF